MQVPQDIKALYLSHGAGPMPLLGDPAHQEMVSSLQAIAKATNKPKAIIVVSAHWEESIVHITHGKNPSLIYDYSGFPQESYSITYPAPGKPDLAESIHRVMTKHQFAADLDDQRGFDHGLYVPLKIMYPQADIPCVQVSLLHSLDAKDHIRLGELIEEACDDTTMLVGSGFSFHNMREFMAGTAGVDERNEAFEKWLIDTCTNQDLDEEERARRLVDWQSAPAARYCHPREEHLLPLHVCYGAARTAAKAYQSLRIIGKSASIYAW